MITLEVVCAKCQQKAKKDLHEDSVAPFEFVTLDCPNGHSSYVFCDEAGEWHFASVEDKPSYFVGGCV